MTLEERLHQTVLDCTNDPAKKAELGRRIAALCHDERLSEEDRIALSVFIASSATNLSVTTGVTELLRSGILAAACATMQGILTAGADSRAYTPTDAKRVADIAVMYADALVGKLLERLESPK